MDSGEVTFLSDFIPEFCMHRYTYIHLTYIHMYLDRLVDIVL